jgi:uncharacterized protein YdeI (YjbR/CyaY-like superfamily)
MRTTPRERMPRDLLSALRHRKGMLRVFKKMRPSCSANYVKWISDTLKKEKRRQRIKGIIEKVMNYGRRHKLLPAT